MIEVEVERVVPPASTDVMGVAYGVTVHGLPAVIVAPVGDLVTLARMIRFVGHPVPVMVEEWQLAAGNLVEAIRVMPDHIMAAMQEVGRDN